MNKKLRVLFGLLLIAALALVSRPSKKEAAAPPQVDAARPAAADPVELRRARLPVLLLPNPGDLPAEVRYALRDRNVTAAFLDGGVVLAAEGPLGSLRVARRFVGAAERAPIADRETGATVSRFVGDPSSWRSGLRAAASLVYAGLWPGVDYRIEPRAAGLEYSLTVAPGADLDAVRFAYEGLPAPAPTSSGGIRVETPAGALTESAPRAFQTVDGERRELACAFELRADGSFGFSVPGRDPARPLLIDPTLDYSTFLGWGNGGGVGANDELHDMALDAAGNVYLAGRTDSDFPATAGAYSRSKKGSNDLFVAKLNSTGTAILWATYLGGTSTEGEPAIALDGSNQVVIASTSYSSDYPVTPGAYRTTPLTGGTVVTKLAADGATLVWSTWLGDAIPRSVALDAAGRVFVAGYTQSPTYPTTPGALGTTYNGGRDAFVTCLAADGASLAWSTFLGSTGDDQVYTMAVSAAGVATVGGQTTSTAFPTTPGALDTNPASPGSGDGFVSRITADGASLVWSTFLRGNGDDAVLSLALDASSNVYIYAYTQASNTFPTTPGTYKPVRGSNDHSAVARLNATGASLDWSTFLGPVQKTLRNSTIAVDGSGNAFVSGHADFNTFPTTAGAFDTTYLAGEAFVLRMNAGGATLQWSTFIGGQSDDWSAGIALDGSGNVVVALETMSPDLSMTAGVLDRTFNGGRDAAVFKFDGTGARFWSTYLGGGENDDRAFAIALDASGNVIIAGQTSSADFPVTPGAYDTTFNSTPGGYGVGIDFNRDAFVACFSADLGTLLWSTFLGGSAQDRVRAIAIDSLGRICLAGSTTSANFPTTPGAYDTTNSFEDAFIARLSADGQSLLLSTFLGGNQDDTAEALALGPGDEFYVCGKAGGASFPTAGGGFDSSYNGGNSDAYVACLSSTGASLTWSTFLGTIGEDVALQLVRASGGDLTVAGHTEQPGFPTTAGAYDTTWNGNDDVFVVRLNSTGTAVVWGTYLGTSGWDRLRGLQVDASGGVTVSGYTGYYEAWPVTPGSFASGGIGFLSALSADGSTLSWSTTLGEGEGGPHLRDGATNAWVAEGLATAFLTRITGNGSAAPWGMGLASGGSVKVQGLVRGTGNRLYLAGFTDAPTFATTAGAYDVAYNGYFDAFVLAVTPPPALAPVVNDGPSADVEYQASATSWTGNWSGFDAGTTGHSIGIGWNRGRINFASFGAAGAGPTGTLTWGPTVPDGMRIFGIVRAEYANGLSLLATSNGVIVDATGPVPPAAPVASPAFTTNAFTVTWNAVTVDPGGSGVAGYEVFRSFNGGAYTSLTTQVGTTLNQSGLAEGTYRYRVRVLDNLGNAGNQSAASNPAVVDATPPDTVIRAGPSDDWGSLSVEVHFGANESNCTFEVRLDGAAWETLAAGSISKSYAGLSMGPHLFEVRATDPTGNVDATPASRAWSVASLVLDGIAPISNSFSSPGALSNWKLVVAPGTAPLWAVDATPATVPGGAAHSAPSSLNYNDGIDYDNGASNSGSATSPVIDVSALTAPRLRFYCNFQTETPFPFPQDIRRVRISSDGFATNRLNEQLSVNPGAAILGPCVSGAWHEHRAALDPAWGPVQVRFEFDTVTNFLNGFAGWFIDDFEVSDLLVGSLEQLDAATDAAVPNGGSPGGRIMRFRSRIGAAAPGNVRLEIEVAPLGSPFSGTPGASVEGGGAGVLLSVDLELPAGTGYRWRARTVDLVGSVTSSWLAFGMNADTDADFVLVPDASGGGGGGGGGCGATGMEWIVVLVLAALLQSLSRLRKARAA